MNHIFSGRFARGDANYDYSGIWSFAGTQIAWKAIVRNAGVVCRPSGRMDDGINEDEVLRLIAHSIEASTDGALNERGAWIAR